jgi:hypothetical protein
MVAARRALEIQRDLGWLRDWCSFLRHISAGLRLSSVEGNHMSSARDHHSAGEPELVVSFVEPGVLDPFPRQLVDRLLYARALLQANTVLAPRFLLGDCAAAHHIILGGGGAGTMAAERLLSYGFLVEPWSDPLGIRFFLSSSHSKAEIRALLVALTIVVRELFPVR